MTAALGKRAAKRADCCCCSPPEGVRPGRLHDAVEDRKTIRCSICGQFCPGKGKFGRRNKQVTSINLNYITRVKPHRRHLLLQVPPQELVPRLGTHLHLPLCLRAVTVPADGPQPALGLESRQFEVTLSGAGVMKDGNRREHATEKEKEKKGQFAKNGVSGSKREGGSRKKDSARVRRPCSSPT